MKMPRMLRRFASAVALATTLAAPVAASSLEGKVGGKSGVPFTTEEVAAEQGKMEGLVGRMATVTNQSRTTTVAVAPEAPCRGYMVHMVLDQYSLTNSPQAFHEALLFATASPQSMDFLRNPERPRLPPQAIQVNWPNSDLVNRDGVPYFGLLINTTLADSLEENPEGSIAGWLFIDNNDDDVYLSSAKPGRGLSEIGVDEPVSCDYSAQDIHVFKLLSKLGRPRVCVDLDSSQTQCFDTTVAYGRGEAPGTYRADVAGWGFEGFPYRTSVGRMGVDLSVLWNPDGTIGTMDMDVNPSRTQMPLEAAFIMAPPKNRGAFWFPYRAVGVNAQNATPSVSVDFTELLEGTTWSHP